MDVRAALEQEHSVVQSRRIADFIGNDAARFAVLMDILLNGTPRMCQRAAWPMGMACERHPELAVPYLTRLLYLLAAHVHEAVHRNIMRTLQFSALPKKLHGRLTEVVFAWIADANKPIAPRASAITVALRLVKCHPDLRGELHLLLEEALRHQPTPGIRSRARKALPSAGHGSQGD